MNEMLAETRDEGVLTLTLGAGVAHPLSLGLIRALHAAIGTAQTDGTKVIVIHGPGRIFCAGHDLKEIAAHRADPDRPRIRMRSRRFPPLEPEPIDRLLCPFEFTARVD